jgi:hypothetical protein
LGPFLLPVGGLAGGERGRVPHQTIDPAMTFHLIAVFFLLAFVLVSCPGSGHLGDEGDVIAAAAPLSILVVVA